MEPQTVQLLFGHQPGSDVTGLLGEYAVAELLARKGIAPFFSSSREGRRGSAARSLASDFHIIEDKKILVEAKYQSATSGGGSEGPYDEGTAVVKYLPICRTVREEIYSPDRTHVSDKPYLKVLAFAIAKALACEAAGLEITSEEHDILEAASAAVDAVIDEKRAHPKNQ
jgi:hypothetical protein